MALEEVVRYLGPHNEIPLTLTRDSETGHFLLKHFLPILQQYHDTGNINETNPDKFPTGEERDELLKHYGIVVTTDDQGELWIELEKCLQLLNMLNLFDLFQDAFEFEEPETDQDEEDSAHSKGAENNTKNENFVNGICSKRINNLQDMDVDSDPHRELGSPLKKLKIDTSVIDVESDLTPNRTTRNSNNDNKSSGNGSSSDNNNDDGDKNNDDDDNNNNNNNNNNTNNSEGMAGPIVTFTHDLTTEFLNSPLKIMKTLPSPIVNDNEQKMKLEAFLQRLLFPEIQEMPISQNNDNNNRNSEERSPVRQQQQVSFDSVLQEVNDAFPSTQLNLNIPVDEHGNTPLHWLTSIANLELVKNLVKHGSNRLYGDNMGESCLVKAVKSVNNYDSGTFEALLDYLYPCLILEDSMNRTILHHIIITSGMTGCSNAAKYYLDILMGWIVKKQNRPIQSGTNDDKSKNDDEHKENTDSILENLDLKWIITNMLNAQDSNGDTCLNIAARLGNISIVDALLDYGADPFIANKSGLRPVDFGAGTSKLQNNNNDGEKSNLISKNDPEGQNNGNNKKIRPQLLKNPPETTSLINDVQSLLNSISKDYETETMQYNKKLESLHKESNEQREKLTNSRDQLANVKQLKDEYSLMQEQLTNLKTGIEEEEASFREESKKLGIVADETSGIDWDSSEYDADEPFKVEFISDFLEDRLQRDYDGDIAKLLESKSENEIMEEIRSQMPMEKINSMLPPTVLLKARINAYKRNDKHLGNVLHTISTKQSELENKFRRVLSLCLKIDENKVDDMLDGLLQAISSEDPQDIDTDEMQDFLKKHAS
ncbi:swi6p [Saccharomyces arboricola H-6]|uniref:Swi6p n=1 Tax=Saccharomyces arboricola (strain H-6 / AS 2.3317 / CBS 10644) TaxID=1160507 RepID=J8PZ79_SACAR|nr:swi6p [Saccharomyces arboricola H-6]